MRRCRLSEQAVIDLEDALVDGLLKFGELQALKYQDSFKRTFELLAYMPTVGRMSERSTSKQEHRFVHGSHVIYYRIESTEIIIESIEHGSTIRDIWNS